MFEVNYCGGKTPLLIGLFRTKAEAEIFVIEEHEKEMIDLSDQGEMESYSIKEKWELYESELKKYKIEESVNY